MVGAPAEQCIGGREVLITDPAMRRIHARIAGRIARLKLPVLLRGESGTGKEILARALHERSPRHEGPFIAINCAALPEHLVESELFGFRAGAFSGAHEDKPGLFEAAHEGTLFLDEVAEMRPDVQAKLLRVLDDHRVRRLGDIEDRDIDVRIVAATYRNLERAVRRRRFRRDLYFRFKGIVIHIPPLRERHDELEALAERFVVAHAREAGLPAPRWSPSGRQALLDHRWPGNVRELYAACGHLVATIEGPDIRADHVIEWATGVPEPDATTDIAAPELPPTEAVGAPGKKTFTPIAEELAQVERTRIQEALAAAGGNRTLAAQLISMPQRTFSSKLRSYGIRT